MTAPRFARASLFAGLALVSLACASASGGARRGAAQEPPRARAVNQPSFDTAPLGRVVLAKSAIELSLPAANAWRARNDSTWEQLEHAPSNSRLELHLTRAERLVRPETCEARARLERPDLPNVPSDEALEQTTVRVPRDFWTHVTVSVDEREPGLIEGHVTAFGASVGRCLAFHFVTAVDAAAGEAEIADRLRLVVDRVLPSLTISNVDQRVTPEPFSR